MLFSFDSSFDFWASRIFESSRYLACSSNQKNIFGIPMRSSIYREMYPPIATLPKQKLKHTIQCFIFAQHSSSVSDRCCTDNAMLWNRNTPQSLKRQGFHCSTSREEYWRHGVDCDWWPSEPSAWSLPLLGAKCTALLWDCVARVPVTVPLFAVLEQWGIFWGLD